MSLSKLEARRLVRSTRSDLPEPDSTKHCDALARFLSESVPDGTYVVVFNAMPGEVDLSSLVARHPQPDSRFAITRTPDEGFELSVHPVGGPTERHNYGYTQPLKGSDQIDDRQIGAVIVPALAFDLVGRRLGRGRGYYDRFLARLSPECLRIGMTGDFLADRVPTEDHDINMSHLGGSFGVLSVPLPEHFVTHRMAAAK